MNEMIPSMNKSRRMIQDGVGTLWLLPLIIFCPSVGLEGGWPSCTEQSSEWEGGMAGELEVMLIEQDLELVGAEGGAGESQYRQQVDPVRTSRRHEQRRGYPKGLIPTNLKLEFPL